MNKKYNYNKEFFDIETKELAYFLGLFMADGHMRCYPKKYTYQLSISLQESDSYILEFFMNFICPGKQLGKAINNRGFSIGTTMRTLLITNKEIVTYIKEKYRINQKKTGHEVIPYGLDKSLIPAFIHGYFDGDGCVMLTKRKRPLVSICCASKKFLGEIKKFLGYGKITRGNCVWRLDVSNNYDIHRFINDILDKSIKGLDRKRNLILNANLETKGTNFTKEELKFIKDSCNEMSPNELAKAINRDSSTISDAIRKHKFRKSLATPYTSKDIKIMKKLYNKLSVRELAEKLGRPKESVYEKLISLGLKEKIKRPEKNSYIKYSEDEIKEIQGYRERGMKYKEISKITGRSEIALMGLISNHKAKK